MVEAFDDALAQYNNRHISGILIVLVVRCEVTEREGTFLLTA